MTPDAYLAMAFAWHKQAQEAAASSRLLFAAGAPMTVVEEALAIAKRALKFAAQLEELAAKAAPMPARD